MDDLPFALIEMMLVFGVVLAWALWEVLRNRRALQRSGEEDRRPDGP